MLEVDSDSIRLVYFVHLVNFIIHFNDWWLDFGANTHVTFDRSLFSTYQESCKGSVTLGDGSLGQVKGKEHVDLRVTPGNSLTLRNVLHVSSVRRNLISESILVKVRI